MNWEGPLNSGSGSEVNVRQGPRRTRGGISLSGDAVCDETTTGVVWSRFETGVIGGKGLGDGGDRARRVHGVLEGVGGGTTSTGREGCEGRVPL